MRLNVVYIYYKCFYANNNYIITLEFLLKVVLQTVYTVVLILKY